jgi:hypothetical protein
MQKNIDCFNKNKYVLVKDAINKNVCSLLTLYALFDENQNFKSEGDGTQVPNAHSKYADPLMESLLVHSWQIIEQNTGLQLSPTYSYYRVYRNGDDLKPHKDRPSCEISATVFLGFQYSKEYSWPIIMDGHSIKMEPGDLVIYRGTELEHSREIFDIGDQESFHVQTFIHYVDKNGPYSEWEFDKRIGIGVKQ